MTAADGGVFNYGNLPFCGSTGNLVLTKPVVGMAVTPDGGGYWLVASDGGVFAFGDAAFDGSAGNLTLTKPVVGMAATPDGGGLLAGGLRRRGLRLRRRRLLRLGGEPPPRPNPSWAWRPPPTAAGYWLVASDGGVFAFGDAVFYGSMGNIHLTKPVVGMAADAATGGLLAGGLRRRGLLLRRALPGLDGQPRAWSSRWWA